MITFIADITDSDIFRDYWVPLICKHREVEFIFGKTKDLKRPKMSDWSNVRFAAEKDSPKLVKHAKNKFIYMTVQNELPTYELMVNLREPKEGLVPKIHGTDKDSSSIVVKRDTYPEVKKIETDVTTYVI